MHDYVIVGAGSAGCTLAGRLSEDPGTSVLLIEAGGRDRSPNIKIPAAFAKQFRTKLDWDFATEPEPHCEGRSLYMPRGKGLGGSSSMNAMLYVRGHPLDYERWVGEGATGWGWEDVKPYFLEAEDNERGASEHHAVGGPLRVEDERSPRPLTGRFLAACGEAGIPRIDDYNGHEQDGAALAQVTQRRGRRWSAADAYLRPALKRPNLDLLTGGQALGLELEGRRARNLQDHPYLTSVWDVPGGGSLADGERPRALLEYLLRRTGPLSSSVAEAFAFMRSRRGLAQPDLQFHFAPAYFVNHGFDEYDGHALTMGPVLVAPRSRGWLRLRSAEPTAKPRILTNTLAEPEDAAALIAGTRLAREIAAAGPLAEVLGQRLLPAEGTDSDDDILADLRHRVDLLYHPVGTCRMGGDEEAVLDPELRVRGVEGLRVVDASAMPTITSGNTNAPTIMIAERGAELIRSSA